MQKISSRISFLLAAVLLLGCFGVAQGLNWEGQTGALLTPFAYTASSPAGLGKPEIAFHYLNGGKVIGNDYQFSITEGIAKRFEIGFTGSFSSQGNSELSYLFGGGYEAVHGKLTVVPENALKTKWVPAIAVGAIGRFNDQRVFWNSMGSYIPVNFKANPNGDFYIVATKTITQIKGLPIVLNFGEKVTNASVFGIAGAAGGPTSGVAPTSVGYTSDAQRWQGRLFGAAAFVVKGPAKSSLILGTEFAQQPRYVYGLGNAATVPTSMSYFVRVVPHIERSPLQVDLGVVQAAGNVAQGLNLEARHQFGMGISYHF